MTAPNSSTEKFEPFMYDDFGIFYQPTPQSLKFRFLEVSDYFDTPKDTVTANLKIATDALNKAAEQEKIDAHRSR